MIFIWKVVSTQAQKHHPVETKTRMMAIKTNCLDRRLFWNKA